MGRDGWHSNLAVELVQVPIPSSYFDSNNNPTIYASQPNPTIHARDCISTGIDIVTTTTVCHGYCDSTVTDTAMTTIYMSDTLQEHSECVADTAAAQSRMLQQQLCVIDTVL